MGDKIFSVKTRFRIFVGMIWLGAGITLFSNTFGRWLMGVGLVVVILAFVYRATMIRCPYCGHKLAGDNRIPDRCPLCGNQLD